MLYLYDCGFGDVVVLFDVVGVYDCSVVGVGFYDVEWVCNCGCGGKYCYC